LALGNGNGATAGLSPHDAAEEQEQERCGLQPDPMAA
jgi:hypothetical protein